MDNTNFLLINAWKNTLRCSFVITVLMSIPSISIADVIDDFKEAASKTGCESIPFSSPRSNCKSIQRDITEYCKSNVVECSDLLKVKTSLIDMIEKSDKQLKASESKRKSIEGKLDDTDVEGEIKKYKDELSKASRAYQEILDKHNKLLDEYEDFDDDNRIDDGYSRAQRCVEAREKSKKLFDEVKDKLDVDGSSLTTDEERELEYYAVKITDHINSKIKGHDSALNGDRDRVKNCKKVLDTKR